jgi:hypothetical protein
MADESTPRRKQAKSKPSQTSTDVVKIDQLGIESGTDTNLPFTTPFRPADVGSEKTDNEELQEVFKDESEEFGPTVRQLVTMRKMDAQARGLYRLLTLPILSALTNATFVPAEEGEEEAEFIDAVFNTPPESGGMTVTFHRFMRQMLMALNDGFTAFEKVFWKPDTGPLAGKYTLQKLAHRPSDTVTFIVDKTGGFAGLRQRSYNGGKAIDVYIPREYAFYYAAQEEERKFYGISFFQSAFYHYDKKVRMYFTAHLAAQRAAVGTRIGTVPTTATSAAKQEFSRSLGNLAFAQWMMVPEGFKVEMLKEAGGFQFLEYINHHNEGMAQSLLAGFFNSQSGGSTSENTPLIQNNQPGDEMFKLMLSAIMDDVANQLNHYVIPQLIDLNFKSGKYPKFTWGKLTDEQKSAISSTFNALASADNVTPEFMRALEEHQAEEFGLEIDYDEVEMREEEEAQAQLEANTLPAVDPETGEPLPVEPGAEAVPGGTAPVPAAPAAGGTPAGSAPAPGGTDPAAPAEVVEEPTGFAMEGDDWSLEEFEDRLLAELNGEDLELTNGLMDMAAGMLALARENTHGA